MNSTGNPGVPPCPKGKGDCTRVLPDKRCFACPVGVVDIDGERGMAWWNGLDDAGRSFWMKLSLGSAPADAWAYFKRCGADGVEKSGGGGA